MRNAFAGINVVGLCLKSTSCLHLRLLLVVVYTTNCSVTPDSYCVIMIVYCFLMIVLTHVPLLEKHATCCKTVLHECA